MPDNFFILTGAMGSGKSTIIEALKAKLCQVVAEPARQILAEQRRFHGKGVPEKDAALFTELMLSRSIYQYGEFKNKKLPVLFDRGIPDLIAYARLFEIDQTTVTQAANLYRYNTLVFVTEDWEDIYTTDSERKMPYEMAQAFGIQVRQIYSELGYKLIEVPKCRPAATRAEFILKHIK